jgi:hypothetical protein
MTQLQLGDTQTIADDRREVDRAIAKEALVKALDIYNALGFDSRTIGFNIGAVFAAWADSDVVEMPKFEEGIQVAVANVYGFSEAQS